MAKPAEILATIQTKGPVWGVTPVTLVPIIPNPDPPADPGIGNQPGDGRAQYQIFGPRS